MKSQFLNLKLILIVFSLTACNSESPIKIIENPEQATKSTFDQVIELSNHDTLNGEVVFIPRVNANLEYSIIKWSDGAFQDIGDFENHPKFDPRISSEPNFYKTFVKIPFISQIVELENNNLTVITEAEHGGIYNYDISKTGNTLAFGSRFSLKVL